MEDIDDEEGDEDDEDDDEGNPRLAPPLLVLQTRNHGRGLGGVDDHPLPD
jgi:hypothetical protein